MKKEFSDMYKWFGQNKGEFAQAWLAIRDIFQKEDFVDFGLMNSHKYREKLLRLFNDFGLNILQINIIVMFFVVVKSKKRVLASMTKFKDSPSASLWYEKVRSFISTKMVQYTHQETETTIAAVHITNSLPNLALALWCLIMPDDQLKVEVVVRNSWWPQLSMSTTLKEMSLAWERDLWTTQIQKGGKDFEKNGFNENYYRTKAKDMYPFVRTDGSLTPVHEVWDDVTYINLYLESWKKFRSSSKTADKPSAMPDIGKKHRDENEFIEFVEMLQKKHIREKYAALNELCDTWDSDEKVPDGGLGALKDLFKTCKDEFVTLNKTLTDKKAEMAKLENDNALVIKEGMKKENSTFLREITSFSDENPQVTDPIVLLSTFVDTKNKEGKMPSDEKKKKAEMLFQFVIAGKIRDALAAEIANLNMSVSLAQSAMDRAKQEVFANVVFD